MSDFETIKTLVIEGESKARQVFHDAILESYEDGWEHGQESGLMDSMERADDWIRDGEYDDAVVERAQTLGMKDESDIVFQSGNDLLQQRHRELHPDGVWGYEHCAICMK